MIKDKKLRAFFKFLISNKESDEYTANLKKYVADAKHNMQWRVQYMTWERIQHYAYDKGKSEGLSQGLSQGRDEKAIEGAVLLVKEFNAAPETAAKKMNAPLERVKEALKMVKNEG